MKRFSAIVISALLLLCGARFARALDGISAFFAPAESAGQASAASSVFAVPPGDLSSSSSFSEIVRGNFAALDILPFRMRVVGTGYGQWGDCTAEAFGAEPEHGFKTEVWGGSLGADWLMGENSFVGIHAVSGRIGIDPARSGYSGSIASVGGVVRLALSETRWYWDVSLGAVRNRNHAESVLPGKLYNSGKITNQLNYHTEFGLKMSGGFTRIEPFVGARYIALSGGGLDPFNPSSENRTATPDSARLLAGSRFAWEYATPVSTIRPQLRGVWLHEFGSDTVFTTDDLLLFPIAGQFGGESFSRDRGILGTGVSAALRDMVDLFFDYSYSFAPGEVSYSVSGGFHVKY